MDAADEIRRLLAQHKAVLVRQNKHMVFRLPTGQNFVLAKTPGDPARAAKNGLAELRRALGIVRVAPAPKGVPQMEELTTPIVAEPQPAPSVLQSRESLKQRLEAAIACTEQEQEALLAAAQKIEQRIQMLKALLPFAEDPAAEEGLRSVLPTVQPPSLPTPTPPEPPQRITDRVQVTRQLVFAATQTFEDTFTVSDVLALMTGGRLIDTPERLRVRSSIAQCMISLLDRGELIRVAEGIGKRQAIWRKVSLDGHGTRA
jgi:hypothetical protein